ncbi:MAG: aspartate--ammonia ligase [Turicibacter sp.]
MFMLLLSDSYQSKLSVLETQRGIKKIKDYFQRELANELNLLRVSAPLFVKSNSGLNDNLNGIERPVSFDLLSGEHLQIVHSLAKWKRQALKEYGFELNEGLYTDMNAIRRDEELSNIHSIYVDQWDWEKIIAKDCRTIETLTVTVEKIFDVLKRTENMVNDIYPQFSKKLPEAITFISCQELEDIYPNLSPKEREFEICKKFGAVFISQVGKKLKSGERHDLRAPDYDDWELNGDILLYNSILDNAFEISSMGIRVSKESLLAQLEETQTVDRVNLPYHQNLINGQYPFTMGGGIGQSRLCMYFLEKLHIGEVQSSIWPEEMIELCKQNNIHLL